MPFFKNQNLIINSQYKLNHLDLMEILIGVLSKDILITKFKQIVKENQEKLERGVKKAKIPVKNIRKKLPVK